MLKKAGLVEVHPGIARAKLIRDLSDIILLDAYMAPGSLEQEIYTTFKQLDELFKESKKKLASMRAREN